MSEVTPFTGKGVARGISAAHPLVFGTFVYGLAFGLIADQAQLSVLQATLMSLVVFSATAQMAALGILSAGISPLASTLWAVMALILVINARYILFSATLRPWFATLPARKVYPMLFILGDGNWMLSMRAREAGERDAGFFFGSGIGSYSSWALGTALGAMFGKLAPNPKSLALDFLLPSFAAAMLIGMVRSKRDAVPIALAGLVAGGVWFSGYTAWAPVLAGLAAGLAAYFRTGQGAADAR